MRRHQHQIRPAGTGTGAYSDCIDVIRGEPRQSVRKERPRHEQSEWADSYSGG